MSRGKKPNPAAWAVLSDEELAEREQRARQVQPARTPPSATERAETAIAQRKFQTALSSLREALPVETSPELASQTERVMTLAATISARADGTLATEAADLARRAESVLEDMAKRDEHVAAILAERAAKRAQNRLEAIAATRSRRDDDYVRSFEYSVLDLEVSEVERRLREAGSLGWDLVAALPGSGGAHRLYLKREVWVTRSKQGATGASAPQFAPGPSSQAVAAGGTGGFFFAGYYESGLDTDMDGDVDGGLLDSLGDLFG
jgi:hypothetical protein